MKVVDLLLASLTIPVLTGCSSREQYCGEAFCLNEKPTVVSKRSPVEDFILYRIEYGRSHYLVYEGNHPNTEHDRDLGAIASDGMPKGFVSGRIRGGDVAG